jgi:hypothetical protein
MTADDATPRSAFGRAALTQIPRPVARKLERMAARARSKAEQTREEKRLAEERELSAAYRAWRRERYARACDACPAGMEELRGVIRASSLLSLGNLLEYCVTARWLHEADADTRFEVLSMLGELITDWRLQSGLPPYDDNLPDGAPDVVRDTFIQLREVLR